MAKLVGDAMINYEAMRARGLKIGNEYKMCCTVEKNFGDIEFRQTSSKPKSIQCVVDGVLAPTLTLTPHLISTPWDQCALFNYTAFN